MEELLVAFQVVTNLETGRNMQALFNDSAAHLGTRANRHVREEDGFFDESVLLDGNTRRKNALHNRTTTDNAACRNDGIDGCALMAFVVARKETCRRLVPVVSTNRPVIVVKVERRIFGAKVHVSFEEGVKRTHVAPVALCRSFFATHDVCVEVVDVHRVFLVQAWNDVLAKVRCTVVCALQEFANEELAREEVVTHASEAPTRTVRHLLRFLRLFFETDHAVIRVNFDNAKFASLFDRHRNSSNREEGRTA